MRTIDKHPIIRGVIDMIITYPAPINLTYLWNFGVYSLICLAVQIITGLFLAMHYTPQLDLAFLSVEHISRDVNYGYLFRYIHANGASMFFICVYIHTLRNIYFGSFLAPRQLLWVIGVIILVLMVITAFMGYVLPWGQMSFWGATVITNLFSAIPFFGTDIVQWLWGGFSVDNATLTRFFALHFFLPFVITALVVAHIYILHLTLSNNPTGIGFRAEGGNTFSPYYTIKDLYGIFLFLIFFAFFLYFAPNALSHPDNFIQANPMVTPVHIVPEWYFLPFYAILRSIPDKLTGVLALGFAIVSLLILPFIHAPEVRSHRWRPLSKVTFWYFVVTCVFLGWLGSQPIEFPYLQLGQLATAAYFSYFYFIAPFIIRLERYVWTPRFSYYLDRYVYSRKWK
jgi:ubiquinol-cytochrome c reductase cytochrome b subunit